MSELLFDNTDADEKDEGADDEIKDLMKSHILNKDEAEHVKEIMDEHGLDEDDAVELKDVL